MPKSRHLDTRICQVDLGETQEDQGNLVETIMQVVVDHPIQLLLFYFSDDFDNVHVSMMHTLVDDLAGSRQWTIKAPEFVDQVEDAVESAGDAPVRTVGGVLQIYSALPPWGDRLPREVDRAQYYEVSAVVEALEELSKATGKEMCIELDNTQIGWIENGKSDDGMTQAFLPEWKRSLELS